MKPDRFAVILAGGYGERFWPLSTRRRPKQLLNLIGGKPLVWAAVARLEGLIPPERIFVLTSRDLVRPIRSILPHLPPEHIMGEPFRRDTATAVALGAGLVSAYHSDASFCVLPADHVIEENDLFASCLAQCFDLAEEDEWLVTMGIRPTWPCTGYGYIEAGDPLNSQGTARAFRVRRFVEKPDQGTAERYIASGTYYWNAGMFIWRTKVLRNAFDRYRPALRELMDRVALCPLRQLSRRLASWYEPLDRISIDYALMEKADRIAMIEALFSWDDVGDWPALARHFKADPNENVVVGENAVLLDAERNIVVSTSGHLTALVGVRDLVVVRSRRATLICTRDRAQDVKKLVQKLEQDGRHQRLL